MTQKVGSLSEELEFLLADESCDPAMVVQASTLISERLSKGVLLKAVYRQGLILLPHDQELIVESCMFDTGAFHSNYINPNFLHRHWQMLSPMVFHDPSVITLADGKTSVQCDQVAIFDISFVNGEELLIAKLPFRVFQMASQDIIIGLPAVLKHFVQLLSHMLEDASLVLRRSEGEIEDAVQNIHTICTKELVDKEILIEPFSDMTVQDAQEDLDTPSPVWFGDVLQQLETGLDAAIADYHETLLSRIAPEFITGTKRDVVKLLREKGVHVFVARNWTGLKGFEPYDLEVRPDLPDQHQARCRPVAKNLWEPCRAELLRLVNLGFYRESQSPISSPIVVAAKKTPPYIRICGDTTWINPYFKKLNWPIPRIKDDLHKIAKFRVFVDLDMTNSFHQIPISAASSKLLSVVTPIGQFEPRFVPEGIPPASQLLQKVVSEIFNEFLEWMIVIFDNFLILAYDYEDAYIKLDRVLDRCIERNLILKLKKSFFGCLSVDFFGMLCSQGSYKVSPKRAEAVAQIPMPTTLREMQSYLGAVNFFGGHIPRYSELTAPLSSMLSKDFPWHDRSLWPSDYEENFRKVQAAVQDSVSIHYPDHDLTWVMRTDASTVGVAAALFQLHIRDPELSDEDALNGLPGCDWQCIGLAAYKFTEAATRWSTIEQEGFGAYFGFKSFENLLRGRQVILETDHHNLLWMEKSAVPKIVRWVMYMRSFDFLVRHLPGKLNKVADHLSRYFRSPLADASMKLFPALSLQDPSQDSVILHCICLMSEDDESFLIYPHTVGGKDRNAPEQDVVSSVSRRNTKKLDHILKLVHNGSVGHWGVRSTMKLLDKKFPGHKISTAAVADFISKCHVCQINRQDMIDSVKGITRHLKPDHIRRSIGIDGLTITPTDSAGNCYLFVISVHFSKLTWGYPSKDKTATSLAAALVVFYSTYGMFEIIQSDPGSEFTSDLTAQLTKWFGITQQFSIVDRPQSSGVEGSNKQILRHIRHMCQEKRLVHEWSSPFVLPLVFFIINSHISSETNLIPYEAHFGSEDVEYFQLPDGLPESDRSHGLLLLLNKNLKILREASRIFQNKLVNRRAQQDDRENINILQAGDYVLLKTDGLRPRQRKLDPKFRGPFEVIQQNKNDVEVRHLGTGAISVVHIEDLKRFYENEQGDAKRAAMMALDLYEVEAIIGYRGEPSERRTLEFLVRYVDGDVCYRPYEPDIYKGKFFEDFCNSRPELVKLLQTKELSDKRIRELNKLPITHLSPGDRSFMNLRFYGYEVYSNFGLPDSDSLSYFVPVTFLHLSDRKRCITFRDGLFDKLHRNVTRHTILEYCSYTEIEREKGMILVTEEKKSEYPNLKL